MDESDLIDLEQTLIDTKEAGNTYLQAAFTKFLFRWVLILPLYFVCSALLPFLKWSALLFLPLFLYSLYQIYYQKELLSKKTLEIQLLIKSIKELEVPSKK